MNPSFRAKPSEDPESRVITTLFLDSGLGFCILRRPTSSIHGVVCRNDGVVRVSLGIFFALADKLQRPVNTPQAGLFTYQLQGHINTWRSGTPYHGNT